MDLYRKEISMHNFQMWMRSKFVFVSKLISYQI